MIHKFTQITKVSFSIIYNLAMWQWNNFYWMFRNS